MRCQIWKNLYGNPAIVVARTVGVWEHTDSWLEEVVQGHVAPDHGWLVVILSRPGRSGEDEPGVEAIRSSVHKRRALNTQLSSGTSAGTFACPAGPYRNCRGEAGTKNEPKWYFVPVQKKGPKVDPHVSNLKSRWFLFRWVQVHPWNKNIFLWVTL